MKSSLLVLYLAWYLTGSCAFAQPAWWPHIESSFVGVNLKECGSRQNIAPSNGSSCSKKPKTCFFGDQVCGGDPYPDERCVCNFRTWKCDPVLCPGSVAPTNPPLPSDSCTDVLIDFETRADGSSLVAGDYIDGTEWLQHGVEISANVAGIGPSHLPRLFDTANPGIEDAGDPDLGSPNEACSPSGPGVGAGGAPGTLGENCLPQGLVLIIQEQGSSILDDAAAGGTITFDFLNPTGVRSVGLMDIEPGAIATSVSVTTTAGLVSSFNAQGLGGNSVQNVPINIQGVMQLKITFATSGAVTNLDLCVTPIDPCDALPPPCETDEQCVAGTTTTDYTCADCLDNTHCPQDTACMAGSNTCQDCPSGSFRDMTSTDGCVIPYTCFARVGVGLCQDASREAYKFCGAFDFPKANILEMCASKARELGGSASGVRGFELTVQTGISSCRILLDASLVDTPCDPNESLTDNRNGTGPVASTFPQFVSSSCYSTEPPAPECVNPCDSAPCEIGQECIPGINATDFVCDGCLLNTHCPQDTECMTGANVCQDCPSGSFRDMTSPEGCVNPCDSVTCPFGRQCTPISSATHTCGIEFGSGTVNVNYPAVSRRGISSTITVDQADDYCVIADLNVVVDIEHRDINDLEVKITHADIGTTVVLWGSDNDGNTRDFYPCSLGRDLKITFDDDGRNVPLFSCPRPLTGTYKPIVQTSRWVFRNPLLSDFNGENTAGRWTLTVVDEYRGGTTSPRDLGKLVSWGLEISCLP